MARNIEIKARLADRPAVEARTAALADRGPIALPQDDTFFACATGRLKLRVHADGHGELIAYERPDASGPKTSDYEIVPVVDPDRLRATLAKALGLGGRVVKERTLYLVGRTRVHLDRVAGLGDFIELEVVLRDGERAQEGEAEAARLMRELGIDAAACVAGAYVDLLPGTAARPLR